MSDRGLDALEAERAVEARLAEAGADNIRRHSFNDAPEAAPETGTPAETVNADQSSQARNELGQFTNTSSTDSTTETAPQETAPEPAQQAETEPSDKNAAVQAFLRKYGDPTDPATLDKALNAAVHAQRRLGELGNELGQTRQTNSEYEQMIAELQGIREAVSQRPQTPLDQATVDWFDNYVMENPQQAMAYAQQQGNPMLVQRGLDTWKQVDPYGAAVYTNQLQNAQMYQQMEQRFSRQNQLSGDATLHLALQSVLNRNPQFTNYSDVLDETMQKYPYQTEQLRAAASSGDAAKMEGAIETLYALSERDTLRSLALSGPAPEDTTTSESVVTPTTSETHEPAPEPTPMDEFRAAFKAEADRRRQGVWVAE